MHCPVCKQSVDSYRAAHWTCTKCGLQCVACFACHPRGSAYEYVDHARNNHVCVAPKLELVKS